MFFRLISRKKNYMQIFCNSIYFSYICNNLNKYQYEKTIIIN